MAHVHGFHVYAARMHPVIAGRLLDYGGVEPGAVLDPFCGSGTTLVEARLRGRASMGVDASPLAVELSWLKTRGSSPEFCTELTESAERVASHAEARRQEKRGASRRYGPGDRSVFKPHVLLELDGLKHGIDGLPRGDLRRALRLVLSSLLLKVAVRPAEVDRSARGLSAGLTIQFFRRKARELASRLSEFSSLLPPQAPTPKIELGDARTLTHIRSRSIPLVVSSPPYPGVYDYARQHELALRWLELDARRFEHTEMGARRELGRSSNAAVSRWQSDLGACFGELARVIRDRGVIFLLLADGAVGRRPLLVVPSVTAAARSAGLEITARAAQRRPHFHVPTRDAFGRHSRSEHLILLRPVA
jgi:hypothetical protein